MFPAGFRLVTAVTVPHSCCIDETTLNRGYHCDADNSPVGTQIVTNENMLVGEMLTASPAQGMVNMWRDSAGIAHYTNKE